MSEPELASTASEAVTQRPNIALSAANVTTLDFGQASAQRAVTLIVANATGHASALGESQSIGAVVPANRLYPHLYDKNEGAGKSVAFVEQAITDVRLALDAFSSADLETLSTQLTLVAANAARAHDLASFNPAFGAVIGFIRRSTLFADTTEVTRQGLNALIQALHGLVKNPTLDISEAADLAENLTVEGWNGEHHVVKELVAAMLKDVDDNVDSQRELFNLGVSMREDA